MSNNNGGPAFPVSIESAAAMRMKVGEETGMTLRDYFAAKAMQALVSNPTSKNTDKSIPAERAYAIAAYMLADAMLQERAK